jgi:predicted phage tail component-like protein
MVVIITIKESLYFTFNGISSKNYNIMNVNVDTGVMKEEYFGAPQTIIEETVRGRDKPYFKQVKKEPLEISVTFAFDGSWTEQKLREVRQWLLEPKYYAPLIFSDDPEKIFYCLYINEPLLLHNCMKEGYITLNFRCNDAYAYSPLTTSEIYDWDESPLVIGKSNFSGGDLNGGVVLNSNNQITLSSGLKKWSDIPPNWTWRDLYENP